MLNISAHRISSKVETEKFTSFQVLAAKKTTKVLLKITVVLFIVATITMFLPWTQNIRAKGYVTTLIPGQRPQNVQALIGGKIVKWYVREGQFVEPGDTIIQLTETDEKYLDPELLFRTKDQIDAKKASSSAYLNKAGNLQDQYYALQKSKEAKLAQNEIKLDQTKLEIQSDSVDLIAAKLQEQIAHAQLTRIESLYNDGLKSRTDYEIKQADYQNYQAKVISITNKLNKNRRELDNLITNRQFIENEYNDKLSKSQSERMSAMSSKYEADATANKLQSDWNAYSVRQANYFVTSPIRGIVTQAIQQGIGEIIKDGDEVVNIMPSDYQLAVEMYVEPIDVTLLKLGDPVRIEFDGWPAIVFSGWPQNSYGTFVGQVFAIDNFISDNGKYRIMVSESPNESPWPEEVRVGGGANTITLLNRVSVGYELWRQLNGFPPDYYKEDTSDGVKTKAPLSKVK